MERRAGSYYISELLASFPGPAQLSVASSTVKREGVASDGKLGGAWV